MQYLSTTVNSSFPCAICLKNISKNHGATCACMGVNKVQQNYKILSKGYFKRTRSLDIVEIHEKNSSFFGVLRQFS